MASKKQVLAYSQVLRSAKAAYESGDLAKAIELYTQSNTFPCASLLERHNTNKFIEQIKSEMNA